MAHSIKKAKRRSSKKKINKRNKITKSKRRSNKYRGGIKEYVNTPVNDTTKLLDHYLVKRIVPNFDKNLLQQDYNTLPITNKDLLIVIDMQNDFVDRPVVKDGIQQLTGPGNVGAFSVNNGNTIITPIIDFAKKCNNAGGNVVFTRDVHTCDHCSFYTAACPSDYNGVPTEPKGVFPPHCVNGTVGSGLVEEIKRYLSDKIISDTIDENSTGKISVVFKGCDQGTDSFGAIAYPENDLDGKPDTYSRDRQIACKPETLDKTGAFYANSGYYTDKSVVTDEFDAVANVKFDKRFTIPNSIENIYIVGLAGDFCVCDTAINLKKQYPSKNVSIIYELTRNAFIPFITPDDATLAAVKQNDPNKKLQNYAFEVDFKVNPPLTRSLSPEEISALTVEKLATCFHFLTDIEELFTRYKDNDVKVIVNPTTIENASASAAIANAKNAIN